MLKKILILAHYICEAQTTIECFIFFNREITIVSLIYIHIKYTNKHNFPVIKILEMEES